MRVHELAKELDITSKELLAMLKKLNIPAKSHMSALDEAAVERVRSKPTPAKPAAAPKKPAPKKPAAAKAKAAPAKPAKKAPPRKSKPPVAKKAEPKPTVPAPAASPVHAETPPSAPAEMHASAEKVVRMRGSIIVRELADQLHVRPNELIATLMTMNMFASINERLDARITQKIAERYGFEFEQEKRAAEHRATIKKLGFEEESEKEDRPEDLVARPPIVTFLGHVDHGKTSLLDRIRETKVTEGESGGITQHIGAYTIEMKGHAITFLDTPGHAAFTAMRARGANLTDIAVIVVAADDGVMPQTREAIAHAQAAEVAIVVAINKIDLPTARPERVIEQLSEMGLTPEDWGGDTICCKVSAQTGEGLDHLLEMLLLQSEVLELKANPKRRARGYVIEAQLEPGMGPTAHLLVANGTLRVGDTIVCGQHCGRVRALINDHGHMVRSAGPSVPSKCLGLPGAPDASEEFRAFANEKYARSIAEKRQAQVKEQRDTAPRKMSLEDLLGQTKAAQSPVLGVILKADVRGSVEAIQHGLEEIKSDKIVLKIILADVGNITTNDVMLASASNAIVIGFHVAKEDGVEPASKREGVEIRLHSVIYELIDEVRESMTGMLAPELRERIIGHAEVKQVFSVSKTGNVAGCVARDGRIGANSRVRVKRGDELRYDGVVVSLKHFQNNVGEVRDGQECGIRLDNFSDFDEGDIIEVYEMEKVAQTL